MIERDFGFSEEFEDGDADFLTNQYLTTIDNLIRRALLDPIDPQFRVPEPLKATYIIPEYRLEGLGLIECFSGIQDEATKLELTKQWHINGEYPCLLTQESVFISQYPVPKIFGKPFSQIFHSNFDGSINMYELILERVRRENGWTEVIYSNHVSVSLDRLAFFARSLDYIFNRDLEFSANNPETKWDLS